MPEPTETGLPPASQADGLRMLSQEAQALARSLTGPIATLSLRVGDCALDITWPDASTGGPDAAPVRNGRPTADVPVTVAEPAPPGEEGLHAVLAPLVGTFYAAPKPGDPPFVAVGDQVRPGDTVGIVEAMKLMNPVVADVTGEVVEVCVADAEPVEYAQHLVRIKVDAP